jgi:hypothetical protein
MSILLFGAGAFAGIAGVLMIGFGIPIYEFSFGNTLILAGATALVGGLIVAGLGVVVSQLQRLSDALTKGAPARAGRPFNPFDPGARAPTAQARIPFPPRPKTESKAETREPAGFESSADSPIGEISDHAAPTLPNPDHTPVTVDDEVSLSPRHPMAPRAEPSEVRPSAASSARMDRAEPDELHDGPPAFDAGWRSPPKATPAPPPRQNTYFDSMWPAEPKAADPKTPSPQGTETYFAEPNAGGSEPAAENESETAFAWQQTEDQAHAAEPRSVAILKSGVVDGMGYTLYVDGSIEAELPQGTLHFASINELRSHLEKTS